MCYERYGNGWTSGDSAAWTVSSCTDASGLGSVRVLFPKLIDTENANEVNGVFHPSIYPSLLGAHVTFAAFNSLVRFHPGATINFYAAVPKERWKQGLFVDFNGPPNSCFQFAFYRTLVWKGDPPPYVPPENNPEGHDEL